MNTLLGEQPAQPDGLVDFGLGPLTDFLATFASDTNALVSAPDAVGQAVATNADLSELDFNFDVNFGDMSDPFLTSTVSPASRSETAVKGPKFTGDAIDQLLSESALFPTKAQNLFGSDNLCAPIQSSIDSIDAHLTMNWRQTQCDGAMASMFPMMGNQANGDATCENNAVNMLSTSDEFSAAMALTTHTPNRNASASAALQDSSPTTPKSAARRQLSSLCKVRIELPKGSQFIQYIPPSESSSKPAAKRKSSPRTAAGFRSVSQSSPVKPTTPSSPPLASPIQMRNSAPAKMRDVGHTNFGFTHFSSNSTMVQQHLPNNVTAFPYPAAGHSQRTAPSEAVPRMSNPRKRKTSESQTVAAQTSVIPSVESTDDLFVCSPPPTAKKARRDPSRAPVNAAVMSQEQPSPMQVLFYPPYGATRAPRPSLIPYFNGSNIGNFKWLHRHISDPQPPPSQVCRETGFEFPIPFPSGQLTCREDNNQHEDDEKADDAAEVQINAPGAVVPNSWQSQIPATDMLNGQFAPMPTSAQAVLGATSPPSQAFVQGAINWNSPHFQMMPQGWTNANVMAPQMLAHPSTKGKSAASQVMAQGISREETGSSRGSAQSHRISHTQRGFVDGQFAAPVKQSLSPPLQGNIGATRQTPRPMSSTPRTPGSKQRQQAQGHHRHHDTISFPPVAAPRMKSTPRQASGGVFMTPTPASRRQTSSSWAMNQAFPAAGSAFATSPNTMGANITTPRMIPQSPNFHLPPAMHSSSPLPIPMQPYVHTPPYMPTMPNSNPNSRGSVSMQLGGITGGAAAQVHHYPNPYLDTSTAALTSDFIVSNPNANVDMNNYPSPGAMNMNATTTFPGPQEVQGGMMHTDPPLMQKFDAAMSMPMLDFGPQGTNAYLADDMISSHPLYGGKLTANAGTWTFAGTGTGTHAVDDSAAAVGMDNAVAAAGMGTVVDTRTTETDTTMDMTMKTEAVGNADAACIPDILTSATNDVRKTHKKKTTTTSTTSTGAAVGLDATFTRVVDLGNGHGGLKDDWETALDEGQHFDPTEWGF